MSQTFVDWHVARYERSLAEESDRGLLAEAVVLARGRDVISPNGPWREQQRELLLTEAHRRGGELAGAVAAQLAK